LTKSGRSTVAGLGEWGLLAGILPSLTRGLPPTVDLGPGDDAAVFHAPGEAVRWVLTTDMLVEDVHFRRAWTDGEDLGHKALAVNLSDLAAMGPVRPAVGVVSLGLPPATPVRFIKDFYRGMSRIARRHDFHLVGGDTVRAEKIVVSVAVLGRTRRNADVLTRGGARPGDRILVTGTLGDAAAGLAVLERGGPRNADERLLARRLRRPAPRLDLAPLIADRPGVTAMMDVSDGLWRSAHILAEAGRVGARLDVERLPISGALRRWSRGRGTDAGTTALVGGEDYELIFTARAPTAERIARRGWARVVGEIRPAVEGVTAFELGQPREVPREFEHFSGS
jgi:thiamine-monophosphate kinase